MSKSNIVSLSHLLTNCDWPIGNTSDLIKNVMAISDKPLWTGDIEPKIREALGIEISKIEVTETIDKLIANNEIISTPKGYVLPAEISSVIKDSVKKRRELGKRVIDKWIKIHLGDYNLNQIEFNNIAKDLDLFIKNFFLTHGVQSYNYLENGLGQEIDINIILQEIPWSSEISKSVGFEKFHLFLQYDDADTQGYLVELLETAVSYLIIVSDPTLLQTLKEKLQGKKIYLDTNVIYRLLGLQGEEREQTIQAMLQVCKTFGLVPYVAGVTLRELKARIKYDSEILRNNRTSSGLAALAYKYRNEDNFISTYWYYARDKKLSIDDFIAYYSHIEDLLRHKGISIDSKFMKCPSELSERCSEIDVTIKKIDNNKSDLACEHDAIILTMIEKICEEYFNFIDYPIWFITTDKKLLRFQNCDYIYSNKAPLVIMPSQLLGILGFTKPSSSSYAEAFLGFFSRAFVSSTTGLDNQMIQQIMGRINYYGGSPEIADKILSDQFLVKRIGSSLNKSDQDEVIYDVLISKSKELQAELEQACEKNDQQKKIYEEELIITQFEKESLKKEAERLKEEALQREISILEIEKINQIAATKKIDTVKDDLSYWRSRLLVTWCILVLIAGVIPLAYFHLSGLWGTIKQGFKVFSIGFILISFIIAIRLIKGKEGLEKVEPFIKILVWIIAISTFICLFI